MVIGFPESLSHEAYDQPRERKLPSSPLMQVFSASRTIKTSVINSDNITRNPQPEVQKDEGRQWTGDRERWNIRRNGEKCVFQHVGFLCTLARNRQARNLRSCSTNTI